MFLALRGARIYAMTETQSPPPPGAETGGNVGLDRDNLRSYQRLTRSLTDRKVAGVAGGLGRHLNVDPTILRVLFVVLCFFGGAGFLLYGVAWLLVPEEGQPEGKIAMSPNARNAFLIGAGIVAAFILLGNSWHGFWFPWPVLLVGIAAVVYLLVRDDRPTPPPTPGAPAPTYQSAYGPTTAAQSAATYAPQGTGAQPPPAPPWLAPSQPAPAYQPPRKRGTKLFGPTLALVALALGGLGLYDAAGGHVSDAAYAALALSVVGVMLLVGAFVGRPGGLIFLGIVAAFALAVTSVVGNVRDLNLSHGDRVRAAPTSAAGVRSNYDIRSGRVVLDLSMVHDPQALDGRTIDVHGRAGELSVVLPHGVESDVSADVHGPGEVDLPDRSSGGFHTQLSGTYGDGPATVTIHTELNVGHIEVRNP
jgi:phage shock protein PspC (stress-responsive transcriptional regulator)